jgi:hypothetical protein
VLTETQVVNGINYRFTFRSADGSLVQVVIYVPILLIVPSGTTNVTVTATPNVGGYVEVSSSSEYLAALIAINKQYPQAKSYSIVGVEEQIVAGKNFRVGLQSNSQTAIKYALFKVYIDLSGKATVTEVSWIEISGYSVQQLSQSLADTLKLHPQLAGFTLISVKNVWPSNGEGLKLDFSNGSKQYTVYIYKYNGQLLNLLY